MSPRVAYWTSGYAPDMEAISSQIATLRGSFPGSVAWGLNRNRALQLSWSRGFIVHPRLWVPFRGATRVLQAAFHVNHIFGGHGEWFYVRAAVKRPIVLTAAVRKAKCDEQLLRKVDAFIVEWQSDAAGLAELGVDRERIHVIPPPVDLERFAPSPPPKRGFSILFASSPESVDGITARGVDALLDAAALRPAYRFVLLWRPWGDSHAFLKEALGRRGLENVEIVHERLPRMEEMYARVHVTVAPFRSASATKSVPNSLIESMACGRPVVATTAVSFAKDAEWASAGRCVEPNGEAIAAGLDEIQRQWNMTSRNARQFAMEHFDQSRHIELHRSLYASLLECRAKRTSRSFDVPPAPAGTRRTESLA
jgi:glycosyltransferase involved in cell wall biosynthesis